MADYNWNSGGLSNLGSMTPARVLSLGSVGTMADHSYWRGLGQEGMGQGRAEIQETSQNSQNRSIYE